LYTHTHTFIWYPPAIVEAKTLVIMNHESHFHQLHYYFKSPHLPNFLP
jgi:hypothetical protein